MNIKQQRSAVHFYQFCSYKPVDRIIKFTEPFCYELDGVDYPYRKKDMKIEWLDAFKEEEE